MYTLISVIKTTIKALGRKYQKVHLLNHLEPTRHAERERERDYYILFFKINFKVKNMYFINANH